MPEFSAHLVNLCAPFGARVRAKVAEAYEIMATRNRGITKYRKLSSSLDYSAVAEPNVSVTRSSDTFSLMRARQ